MSFSKTASILLGALVFIGLNVQAATTFSFRVQVPQTSHSCADEANMLNQRFTAATGIESAQGTCQGTATLSDNGQSYELYTLLESYQADSEIVPYTANFQRDEFDTEPTAIYPHYADCVKDMESQSQIFAQQTKLSAVTAFCSPISYDMGFALQIEGFGTPATQLFALQPVFDPMDAQTLNQVNALITKYGGVMAKEAPGTILYYAPDAINLSTDTFGDFNNLSECQNELSDATAILKAAGAQDVLARCLTASADGNGFTTLQAFHSAAQAFTSDDGDSSQTYYSFADCNQDMGRVIAQKQVQSPEVLGGICVPNTGSPGQYVLAIYSEL